MKTEVLDIRHDPMGAAIADFFKNGVAGRLRVHSSMFDEDEIPVDHLFREEEDMGLSLLCLCALECNHDILGM